MFILVFTLVSAFAAVPASLPQTVRVESSAPRAELWNQLPPRERNLAFHLLNAAREGRSLMFYESHRHALAIRDLLTKSLSKKNLQDTKALLATAFNEYLVYTAKFLDNYGPYDMRSQAKYVMSQVTRDQVKELMGLYSKLTPQHEKEILDLLFDPQYELKRKPVTDVDRLEETGGNLYEKGVSKEEVNAVLDKSLKPSLNCRVVRGVSNLKCDLHTVNSPGILGKKLQNISHHLLLAKNYAGSERQKKQIDYFLTYLKSGDEADFRQFNIEWLKDGTSSTIDLMIGWVETYDDWLNRIGSWENYVLVVDRDVTKKSAALAKNAQYFEDKMPYEFEVEGVKQAYKKVFPADYSPPAIMGYYFEEVSSIRTGGFNLPNYEDIRKDIGFKNVIRLPMPGQAADPEAKAMRQQVVEAFTTQDRVKDIMELYDTAKTIHVLLHEIIGHGSGTYDAVKYADGLDPSVALGALGASLEEERADLTGLVFGTDPKLIDAGVVADAATLNRLKKTLWDLYLAVDFSSAVSRAKSLAQAHVRGRFLLIAKLLEAKAVAWVPKDGGVMTPGNQVLSVIDYEKCHEVAVKLLSDLQRIKALREVDEMKVMFAKYAATESINEPWAWALVDRGKDIAFFRGFVDQPWRISKDRMKIETFGQTTLESIAPYWGEFYGAN